jgi:hypothetical protein
MSGAKHARSSPNRAHALRALLAASPALQRFNFAIPRWSARPRGRLRSAQSQLSHRARLSGAWRRHVPSGVERHCLRQWACCRHWVALFSEEWRRPCRSRTPLLTVLAVCAALRRRGDLRGAPCPPGYALTELDHGQGCCSASRARRRITLLCARVLVTCTTPRAEAAWRQRGLGECCERTDYSTDMFLGATGN